MLVDDYTNSGTKVIVLSNTFEELKKLIYYSMLSFDTLCTGILGHPYRSHN